MAAVKVPAGLAEGGSTLWRGITASHTLDASQQVTLLEACRAKDRLDKLDEVLRGEAEVWLKLTHRLQTEDYELRVDQALAAANTTANLLKQLLAALRLPDEVSGKRPQQRGGGRGAYAPTGVGARVSSMDLARQQSTRS